MEKPHQIELKKISH